MEWNGPAYSPEQDTVRRRRSIGAGRLHQERQSARRSPQSAHYYGGAVTPDPREQAKGWLQAIDADDRQARWKNSGRLRWWAGVTATSGGMLFTGDLNNDFLAIDASNGNTLYRFNTGGTIGGGVISYEIEGKQYVATTSGMVSGFFGGSGLPAVVVFAAGRSTAPVAMKPLDPDHAPIAAVDRFSEKAAITGACRQQYSRAE